VLWKNYSTKIALVEIIKNISRSLDNKESSLCISIDLSEAFDTNKFEILLNKLEHYGIRSISSPEYAAT